jgi:ribosomal protein S27E
MMGLLSTQTPPKLAALPETHPVCRCGHCRAVIDVSGARRRVRCPTCGRSNTTPVRVRVACKRCHRSQRVRFGRRGSSVLCANCGYPLYIGEIELVAVAHRVRQVGRSHRHVSQRERAVFVILLYALVLLFFLLWLTLR